MFNHDEKNTIKALGLEVVDALKFLRSYAKKRVACDTVSQAIEKVAMELESLEGEEKLKYWHCILLYMSTGLDTIVEKMNNPFRDELMKEIEKIAREVVNGTVQNNH